MPPRNLRRPVTLDAVELRVLQIPLVSPFTTSFGTETVREVVIVTAETPTGADGAKWSPRQSRTTPASTRRARGTS